MYLLHVNFTSGMLGVRCVQNVGVTSIPLSRKWYTRKIEQTLKSEVNPDLPPTGYETLIFVSLLNFCFTAQNWEG